MTPGSVTAPAQAPAPPGRGAGALRWLPATAVVPEDIDISGHLLVDMALRHVYLRGTCTIHLLSRLMKLSL